MTSMRKNIKIIARLTNKPKNKNYVEVKLNETYKDANGSLQQRYIKHIYALSVQGATSDELEIIGKTLGNALEDYVRMSEYYSKDTGNTEWLGGVSPSKIELLLPRK
jgi:hypothetical protein